jgi:DDE domain
VLGAGCKPNSPELNKRCRSHLKRTNKSYRVDETYIKVKGQDKYLYRAMDSTGQTIDFLLAAKRDTAAAKRFFEKVFNSPANPIPRVINVDKNAAYPAAVDALKAEGTLPHRVRLRQCNYLNNVIEQDHRTVKKRTWLAKVYFSKCLANSRRNRNDEHDPPRGESGGYQRGMLLRKQDSLPCYSPSLPNCLNRLLPLYCTRLRLEQSSQRNRILCR